MSSLHGMESTHAGLHPGNVVLDNSFTILLIDVGLSQAVKDVQSEDGVYGRLAYLPPEVLMGKQHTKESDIYCLGTLLWQLVVGVPPRDIASLAVFNNKDGLHEELIPGAPSAFQRCWQPDPNLRPNAHEVTVN